MMLEPVASNQILTSFVGTALALVSAGLVWVLKSAHTKHVAQILALARFERMYAKNLTLLKDQFDEIDNWINSLSLGRPYSFSVGDFYLDEEGTYKLSDLKLITRILSLNYKLRRTGFDIGNIYQSYWETIHRLTSIPDQQERDRNLTIFHENTKGTLEKIKQNYSVLRNEIVVTVAHIRAAHHVRKHSLFGYLDRLFVDVYPRVSEKSIKKQTEILEENISKIGEIQEQL